MIVPAPVGPRAERQSAQRRRRRRQLIALVTQRRAETEGSSSHPSSTRSDARQIARCAAPGWHRGCHRPGPEPLRVHGFVSTSRTSWRTVEELPDASRRASRSSDDETVQAQMDQYVSRAHRSAGGSRRCPQHSASPGLLADRSPTAPTCPRQARAPRNGGRRGAPQAVSTFLNRRWRSRLRARSEARVKWSSTKTQREYISGSSSGDPQARAGEDDPQQAEITSSARRWSSRHAGRVARAPLKEVTDSRIPSASPEVGVIRNYVDWLVGLPWTRHDETWTSARLPASWTRPLRSREDQGSGSSSTSRSHARVDHPQPDLCFVGPPGVGRVPGQVDSRARWPKFRSG